MAITAQTEQLEREAQDRVAEISAKAQSIADSETLGLESTELEARRRLEQSEWLDAFLDSQVKSATPTEFLHSWLCHCRARAELLEPSLPAPVATDISMPVLSGSLGIATERSR